MAEYHEVRVERLYLKEPGTEKLRKTAAGRMKHLLATGWRETGRWHRHDHIAVRLERTGVAPKMTRLPKPEPRPQGTSGRRSEGGGGGSARGVRRS
jgi:hypothetical protein